MYIGFIIKGREVLKREREKERTICCVCAQGQERS
jgi:hypothetical protein